MRTTTRGIYALKAILALAADSSKDNPMALHIIAENEQISAEFLQQIFFKMRKAGLIAAYRGPGGGFYLLKDKSEISVLSVLEAAGESMELSPCADTRVGGKAPCAGFKGCCAGQFWMSLENEIKTYASSKTLADLMGAKPS
ncbi:MAG TPA: Rrf2 family transcriptional regulator [Rectinemataceae bacterium]|nr:Rrf2 family transcriptional regulator [Rectinemataceae bacterium]